MLPHPSVNPGEHTNDDISLSLGQLMLVYDPLCFEMRTFMNKVFKLFTLLSSAIFLEK